MTAAALPRKLLAAIRRGDLAARVARRVRRRRWRPAVRVEPASLGLRRLGSDYGGWTFLDAPALRGATVVSCGVGEDISFDVAFAAACGARVILVDPTPRAVAHFREAMAALGRPAARGYAPGGRQPVDAYDLSTLTADSFAYVEKAIWTEATTLKFYAPETEGHVSHSLTAPGADAPHIAVEATTLPDLMQEFGLDAIPLLKLDVEGAETAVLSDMLERGICPGQILVEFDELSAPGPASKALVEEMDARLRDRDYRLMHVASSCNFLYVRRD